MLRIPMHHLYFFSLFHSMLDASSVYAEVVCLEDYFEGNSGVPGVASLAG